MLTADPAAARTKDPDATRARLLASAFEEIYRHGYGAASVDRILSQTHLTKGALYHHFGSKAELGCAVIDEVIGGWIAERWIVPLEGATDPVAALVEAVRGSLNAPAVQLECGCPLNNLTQELANADGAFRDHLLRVFDRWRGGVTDALARGQAHGTVRADIDPGATATFIVSALEGLAGTAKSTRSLTLVLPAVQVLLQFLESLRPPGRRAVRRAAPSRARRR